MQKSDETIDALSSTEMVERVSGALIEKLGPALSGGPSVTVREVARAAIEAMREPTEQMVIQAYENCHEANSAYLDSNIDFAAPMYSAMIAAALGK